MKRHNSILRLSYTMTWLINWQLTYNVRQGNHGDQGDDEEKWTCRWFLNVGKVFNASRLVGNKFNGCVLLNCSQFTATSINFR